MADQVDMRGLVPRRWLTEYRRRRRHQAPAHTVTAQTTAGPAALLRPGNSAAVMPAAGRRRPDSAESGAGVDDSATQHQ